MWKRLKAFANNLANKLTKGKTSEWATFKGQGAFGIPLERQIIKRTHYKPGDQYQVGEGIVTVHANKESMLTAIALVNKRREERHTALWKRAEDIMLMSPKQLQELGINEWLQKRSKAEGKIRKLLGRFYKHKESLSEEHIHKLSAKYGPIPPELKNTPIDSYVPIQTMQSVKEKEKVK